MGQLRRADNEYEPGTDTMRSAEQMQEAMAVPEKLPGNDGETVCEKYMGSKYFST
jgi:hypothetical protein